MAINAKLLKLLACPLCKTAVEFVHDHWLLCSTCFRKYPIVNDIPVMLIEEGTKFIDISPEDLPNPNEND